MDVYLSPYKELYDPIHGYFHITKLASMIIDTVEFQRLRYLHQLGTCKYVFESATHTRFEHSLGTYNLTGQVLKILKLNNTKTEIDNYLSKVPELKQHFKDNQNDTNDYLDDYICELIKISGLCHDLGHGPFSHMFDDMFVEDLDNPYKHHETRSCLILQHIIKNNDLLYNIISDNDITFMCKLINPDNTCKCFIYQIVSNNINSIDVDKLDYIKRDTHQLGLKYSIDIDRIINNMVIIDNHICYPDKMYYDIVSLFKTRYRLHKQIYQHKVVLTIQHMFDDIMKLIDKFVGITDSIESNDKFRMMTDEYIISCVKMLYNNLDTYSDDDKIQIKKAYNLWININKRYLYKCVRSIVSKNILNYQNITDIDKIKNYNIIVHAVKIGFVTGEKNNPLNRTYFYNKYNRKEKFKISNEHKSFLESRIYQEYLYTFILKDYVNDNTLKFIKDTIKDLV